MKSWMHLLAVILACMLAVTAWAQDEDEIEQTRAEIKLGRQATRDFEKRVRVVSSGADVDRLRKMLKKLAPASGRSGFPWSVKVINSPQVNAITFPAGLIYVYRGLLDLGLDDNALAGIMAHEVIHASKSHGYRRLLQMEALGTLSGGQDGMISGMTKILLISGVGRTYENQADRLGIQIAKKAGYDPRGLLTAMKAMQKIGDDRPGLITGMVATHPPSAERIKKIQAELKSMGK